MDIRILLGKTIRNYRISLGYSQEQCADMIGIDRTYLGGVERGERNISIVNLHKISLGMGIPMSEMFKKIEDQIQKQQIGYNTEEKWVHE